MLQELVQKEHDDNVTYTILEESGPDHNKSFLQVEFGSITCLLKGKEKVKKKRDNRRHLKLLSCLKAKYKLIYLVFCV